MGSENLSGDCRFGVNRWYVGGMTASTGDVEFRESNNGKQDPNSMSRLSNIVATVERNSRQRDIVSEMQ